VQHSIYLLRLFANVSQTHIFVVFSFLFANISKHAYICSVLFIYFLLFIFSLVFTSCLFDLSSYYFFMFLLFSLFFFCFVFLFMLFSSSFFFCALSKEEVYQMCTISYIYCVFFAHVSNNGYICSVVFAYISNNAYSCSVFFKYVFVILFIVLSVLWCHLCAN